VDEVVRCVKPVDLRTKLRISTWQEIKHIPENWFEDAKATKIGHPRLPAGKDPKDIGQM
jgi:hypothetical protein